jgi:hypothetical protein
MSHLVLLPRVPPHWMVKKKPEKHREVEPSLRKQRCLSLPYSESRSGREITHNGYVFRPK